MGSIKIGMFITNATDKRIEMDVVLHNPFPDEPTASTYMPKQTYQYWTFPQFFLALARGDLLICTYLCLILLELWSYKFVMAILAVFHLRLSQSTLEGNLLDYYNSMLIT
ncbi:hypothetical protein WISP_02506 [Willisornis vidua]|uniref:Uncharacterized protein n=1 Tax=Willisornis vidua TaxID=1566151 RepID=A0ABQ9E0A1_9PASS|nr:hypothetical protein WISP_02506 [Willisornis vidua]